MGIKEINEYDFRVRNDVTALICTSSELKIGQKRKGVIEIKSDDEILFVEFITAKRRRSKQIARTKHFSVLARPDGSMYGTFHFDPNSPKIRGKLSAEFWQAICVALDLKIVEANEQN